MFPVILKNYQVVEFKQVNSISLRSGWKKEKLKNEGESADVAENTVVKVFLKAC